MTIKTLFLLFLFCSNIINATKNKDNDDSSFQKHRKIVPSSDPFTKTISWDDLHFVITALSSTQKKMFKQDNRISKTSTNLEDVNSSSKEIVRNKTKTIIEYERKLKNLAKDIKETFPHLSTERGGKSLLSFANPTPANNSLNLSNRNLSYTNVNENHEQNNHQIEINLLTSTPFPQLDILNESNNKTGNKNKTINEKDDNLSINNETASNTKEESKTVINDNLPPLKTSKSFPDTFEYFNVEGSTNELISYHNVGENVTNFTFIERGDNANFNPALHSLDYYDYDDGLTHHLTTIRKCCEVDQFFSLIVNDCENRNNSTKFETEVDRLIKDAATKSYNIEPGSVTSCPYEASPIVLEVYSNDTYHLINGGFLLDVETGKQYDHVHYCLEVLGETTETGSLNVVYCPLDEFEDPLNSTRKCCYYNEYLDQKTGECKERSDNMTDFTELTSKFARYDVDLDLEYGQLDCPFSIKNTFSDNDAYLKDRDQLYLYYMETQYPTSDYCIEDLLSPGYDHFHSVAFVCTSHMFRKCCESGKIYNGADCIDPTTTKSDFMTDLENKLDPWKGVPDWSEACNYQSLEKTNDSDIQWGVDNNGYLYIEFKHNVVVTERYCVDDYYRTEGLNTPVAYVCKEDLVNKIPVNMEQTANYKEIGKCCLPGQYLNSSSGNCIDDMAGLNISKDVISEANATAEIIFSDYPVCSKVSKEYHSYILKSEDVLNDHAQFDINFNLEVYSMDRGCIEHKTVVPPNEYCIDYWIGSDEEALGMKNTSVLSKIVVFTCIKDWKEVTETHKEKHPLTAAFLLLSCAALVATIIALASIRVRRGLVTVKKMNTLAGRILMSYVTSSLVGFLCLSLSLLIRVEESTLACRSLAGLMNFALLSGFFWNTSICLESLLLTLSVSVSENRRYVYHSLWAWGVPGIIMAVTLLLDAYREQLPCYVITARIGLFYCSYSDPDAQLLYFYFPIGVTLLANMVLLISAKLTRQSKLKRLEKGMGQIGATNKRLNTRGEGGKRSDTIQSPNQPSSGMRTHQTRNLWAESIRLVMWSGATWLLEFVGFLISRYLSHHQENWYDYLWYIPLAVNALRGCGIFIILVLTPENRTRMKKVMRTFTGTARFFSKYSGTTRQSTSCAANHNYTLNSADHKTGNGKRNNSISSQMTTLSSTGRQSVRSDYKTMIHPHSVQPSNTTETKFVSRYGTLPKLSPSDRVTTRRHSLGSELNNIEAQQQRLHDSKSLMKRRLSSTSIVSTESTFSELEFDNNVKRRSSLAAPVTLPRVNEEDPYEELNSKLRDTP